MDRQRLKEIFQNRKAKIMGDESFSHYAVLLPIIEKDNELQLLFEVRANTLRRQPGEICFPGGRVDHDDRSEEYTAIRETSEELGIRQKDVVDVFPLDFMVNPFGTIIYPYVGFIQEPTAITPNPDEVAEVFTVPLSYLQKTQPDIHHIQFKLEPEENFPYDKIIGGEKYKWQARAIEEHFYYYENKVIWGLTAKILSHFLSMVKEDI